MPLILVAVAGGIALIWAWGELALLCRRLAEGQGRDPASWTIFAVVAPMLALAVLMLFPPPTVRR
ncbi:MAG: hypothetical protein AB7V19_06035 [Candidatus Bipolaricaulia bacterium]